MKVQAFPHKQQGAATLLTALVLLISITLVILLTAKTVLVETQVTADNYRTSQATAAATAAMDQAVAYFYAGGLDQDGVWGVDYKGPGTEPTTANCAMPAAAATTAFPMTLTAGAQTTLAHFYFNNTPTSPLPTNPTTKDIACGSKPSDMTQALVTAKGWSDDCTAVRTITQCVTTFKIFPDKRLHQPVVSKAGVGAFGNATLINRYTNSNIWSGGAATASGAAFATYLRPSNTESADYTTDQLDSADKTANTQLVSNKKTGNGIDIITDDPTLGTITTSTTDLTDPAKNQLFYMLFAQTKSVIKAAADTAGQLFPTGTSLTGKTGLVWVEGDGSLSGNDVIGSPTSPVILIINGDLSFTGGTIYGVVYVTGATKITGNPVVKGSIVAENSAPSTGAGALTLVYKPWGGDGTASPPPFMAGTGAVIAGSWKDWGNH